MVFLCIISCLFCIFLFFKQPTFTYTWQTHNILSLPIKRISCSLSSSCSCNNSFIPFSFTTFIHENPNVSEISIRIFCPRSIVITIGNHVLSKNKQFLSNSPLIFLYPNFSLTSYLNLVSLAASNSFVICTGGTSSSFID